MHAPAPDQPLTCLSCGYDLRAASGADEKCPECGFPIRDSVVGHARVAGRWAWKVRVGVLMMLVATPWLIVSNASYGEAGGGGIALVNFPGIKVWGTPLGVTTPDVWLPATVAVIVNTVGLFLLTTPDRGHERAMSLRRWVRVYSTAGVVCSALIATPHLEWTMLGGYSYDQFIVLLLAETPGTALLYLYVAKVARERLRDPQLARRSTGLLMGALPLQILGMIVWTGGLPPLAPLLGAAIFWLYGVAIVCVGLWAVDFTFDFYRAMRDVERDPATG